MIRITSIFQRSNLQTSVTNISRTIFTHQFIPTQLNTSTALINSKQQQTRKQWFHGTSMTKHGYSKSELDPKTAVSVTFIDREGKEDTIQAPPGKSLLEIAHANHIDLEGACEGSLACSTCHVYLDQKTFDNLEEPCDDENDMLDLAFGLGELSRLGCQVKATKENDGMKVTLPPATRNMAVDGYVPQPH